MSELIFYWRSFTLLHNIVISVRNFVSAQKCIKSVYVGSISCKIRCPELAALLHPYYKVSSSTRPSGSLFFHHRPDDLFAIEYSTNIRSCPFFVKYVQVKEYTPSTGAVNLPVVVSYPSPMFVTIWLYLIIWFCERLEIEFFR